MQYINNEIEKFEIEKKLHEILFIKKAKKHSLEWGMNYITFSQSKRLRPLLLLEANSIFSKPDNDSYILCSAVELIHTYSLVHDDLPCMDDDDLRRGVETLHRVKNEAYAVLVGDSLLTRCFELLSLYSKKEILPKVLSLFNKKAGFMGMIYGQILDMEGENKKLGANKILNIYKYKTGSLIELSLMLGAVNQDGGEKYINILEKLGTVIGYIFQLKDDILDITGNEEILGKKIGSDEKNKKSSIPITFGLKKSNALLNDLKRNALKYINLLPSNKEFFDQLIEFIINRDK